MNAHLEIRPKTGSTFYINTNNGLLKIDPAGKEWILDTESRSNSCFTEYQPPASFWVPVGFLSNDCLPSAQQKAKSDQ